MPIEERTPSDRVGVRGKPPPGINLGDKPKKRDSSNNAHVDLYQHTGKILRCLVTELVGGLSKLVEHPINPQNPLLRFHRKTFERLMSAKIHVNLQVNVSTMLRLRDRLNLNNNDVINTDEENKEHARRLIKKFESNNGDEVAELDKILRSLLASFEDAVNKRDLQLISEVQKKGFQMISMMASSLMKVAQ